MRRLATVLVVGALPPLSACEIEEVSIPRTEVGLAMHGVLSASAPSQVVLLERTRNGSIFLVAPPFDLGDPVVSDAGVAEPDAVVRLTAPDGTTFLAREDSKVRDDRKGDGIYRFSLPGAALVRGGTYRLSITTVEGQELSAETSVPEGDAAATAFARSFDRASDTVRIEWPATPGARAYFVRVESPFGPLSFFTEQTSVRLPGLLRNADEEELPRVFFPGFQQAVTVSAVDSNFYDWYRSQNDELSGSGLVNRVQGGLGVFGSLVRLRFEDLRVVAPQDEAIEGVWRFAGTPQEAATTPYLRYEIYVESKAARGDQPDALSGRYIVRPRFGYTGCLTCGLLGTTKNGEVELRFIRDWSALDTVDTFSGELRGDTLVGAYRLQGGIVKFVKEQ